MMEFLSEYPSSTIADEVKDVILLYCDASEMAPEAVILDHRSYAKFIGKVPPLERDEYERYPFMGTDVLCSYGSPERRLEVVPAKQPFEMPF